MAAIALEAVWKYYGAVEAVRNLTVSCADGEMLALLGPSGCGKSSTLKMIAGIESTSRGEIRFNDRLVTELPPGARNIAMVFEDYALYPHLSVFDNVAFPLRIMRTGAPQIDRRVGEILALLGLTDVAMASVKGLSGGAQQRVAIGRALIREPELVLFDEPLSHLDGDHKVQLRTEIKRLQRTRGLTSILVTHDQTEATAMADRIAVMNRGVLQQVGTPQELYERPANLFVANFIGEPPMNLLRAIVEEHDGVLSLSGEGWSVPLSLRNLDALTRRAGREPLIVGIRPEHIRLGSPHAAPSARGLVTFREFHGDTEVIHLSIRPGDRAIVAEISDAATLRDGEVLPLCFPPHAITLFDAASGASLVQAGPCACQAAA
jgi:multiple sugar transport system ATP-binding protein